MTNWRTTIQDLIENSVLRALVFTRYRWILSVVMALLVVVAALGLGWLVAEFGALAGAALVLALGYAVWALKNIEIAYVGVIAVITLFPFGSLPFKIGFVPTFLDLTLLALFSVWFLPYALGEKQRIIATPAGGAVLAFALLAIGSFVAGLSHGALTSYLIRHFAEILLSIAVFFLVVNVVDKTRSLGRFVFWLALGATAAAALGIILYFLPDNLVVQLLSALARFGYPTGPGVLRYVRDNPELMKRATSTSVDPNVLGSLLNIAIVTIVPQLFAERPFIKRGVLLAMLGVMGLGLGLTISRGSIIGAALAVLVIAVLRYRKLFPLFMVALVLFLVLPWTQELVLHFVEGFQISDLSTQMRMGEYKDALILIRRYPILGVGFAGAPDIDIYVSVANLYMMIAAQMGLVGLAVFLLILGVILVRFWRLRPLARTLPKIEPLWYGLHAAIIAGMVGGVFDRYFFSLEFHHSVTLFWLILGLAAAASQIVETSAVQTEV